MQSHIVYIARYSYTYDSMSHVYNTVLNVGRLATVTKMVMEHNSESLFIIVLKS